jgi:hypothetical protein
MYNHHVYDCIMPGSYYVPDDYLRRGVTFLYAGREERERGLVGGQIWRLQEKYCIKGNLL